MTSGLRKIHKYIWLFLAITVPAIMFLSIKNLDIFSPKKNASTITLETSKKNAIASTENNVIKASLFETHVEIILKSTLKNSSSIVYEMDTKGNRSSIIGQLTTVGIYKFDINNLLNGIIIYDALKNVEITKLTF